MKKQNQFVLLLQAFPKELGERRQKKWFGKDIKKGKRKPSLQNLVVYISKINQQCVVPAYMYASIFLNFLVYKPRSTQADHKLKWHGTYQKPSSPPLSQAHSLEKTGKQRELALSRPQCK